MAPKPKRPKAPPRETVVTPPPICAAIGRPKSPLSAAILEEMIADGATMEEVADLHGVVRQTLYNRIEQEPAFMDALKRGRARAGATLRKTQVTLARAGNPAMLIWLGKQMLGQREPRLDDAPPDDSPLTSSAIWPGKADGDGD